MSRWTRKMMLGGSAGHGDRILASVHDPAERWYWREVTPERGFFDFEFRARRGVVKPDPCCNVPRGFVVVEPHVKGSFSADNKDWGWERWAELVDSVALPWLQLLYPGARRLPGVPGVSTQTFSRAVDVLARCCGFVGTNGGLQYAAAALNLPAVIVWGSFAPPEVLGYADHWNISVDDPEGLGWRVPHLACRSAMEAIKVETVADACLAMFRRAKVAA